MKFCLGFLTMALSAVSAHAMADATLATGGVYGGPGQRKAYCYVFNAGTTDFLGMDGTIVQDDGALGVMQLDRACSEVPPRGPPPFLWGHLGPGVTCRIAADIQAGHTYGCVVTVPGRTARRDVRGTMDIRDGADRVLISSPLR